MKKIDDNPYELSWLEEDIENRLGFHAGRYTSVNKGLSLLFALVLLFVFGGAIFGLSFVKSFQPISDMFLRSGNVWTLGPAMLLFFISITSLFFKGRKLTLQKRALSISTVPQNPDFVLNEQTAETALTRLRKVVDNPRHFILLNRVQTALASLHNIGAISEVASILKNQADNDENQVSSSYTMVSGAVWAIPVLGFIGTVMGLSSAIGNFAGTLSAAKNIEAIKGNLQSVTGGLSTAFETTLVALICALIIQLYLNYMQQKESDFLDECNDYCHTHVISKLRLAEPVLEDRSPLAPTAKNIPDIKEEKAPIKAEAGHSSDPSEQEVKTPNNRSKDL